MEQPNAPKESEQRLLRGEHERHSEWEDAPSQNAYANEYAEREKQEWQQSDVIFCGSSFVRDEIERNDGPTERCMVVPYGVNSEVKPAETRRVSRSKLRVLTVGTVGLRKGTPYVLQAARKCASIASFRMVGGVEVSDTVQSRLAEHVDLVGRIPRSEVEKHYRWADVFLLPSICEGSATVTYEAMAAGLPVICTPNTGSIVRNEKEGFIVPIRNADAIAEKINKLSSERELLEHMSHKARARYEEGGSLESYRKRLVNTIISEMGDISE
ncbi:glycosyltransferase family 4 protein [Salinibacter ruber]|uniref:glycosyltransferase family 4 protein n=1 Tax=Salinibacter ruber TaxID=146919 RepID=UPI00216A436F|nr:glycosyltransferase family 4 protein [Salinibacter ruber]MCS3642384.1 glycosyltransferase involved in cell wall biosynthesis [Salinibacter ruber]